VSPLRGEKPQNRPLSKRNTGRFALRAMLPVISEIMFRHNIELNTTLKFLFSRLLSVLKLRQILKSILGPRT